MADYKKLVYDKEQEWHELFNRMDTDKEMIYLRKYIMKDAHGRVIPDIVNVTLNRPALFTAVVESALAKSTEQRVVNSSNKDIDTAYIEDCLKAAFDSANERRILQGRSTVNAFLDQQFCRRGRGASRVLFQMVEGELVADITPWDTRYVTYEMGTKGLDWCAYKTIRTQDAIEAEYGIKTDKKTAEVLDVWHPAANEIWIAGEKHNPVEGKTPSEQEHKFGYTPVVIRVVSLGSLLADDDYISHYGESLLFLIRTVVPELNRLISIMQTLNLKAVKPPMMAKIRGQGQPPDPEEVTAMASITRIEPDESIEPISYGDAQRSAQMAYGILDKAIQEGSLSSFDLGTFNQPMSAIALVEIGEGRDQVFAPRLGARGMMNQMVSDMIVDQLIKIGGIVELGTKGHKTGYNTEKLKGDYETTFQYFVKSPKIDAGLYTLAAAAGNLIPEHAKRVEILQRPDPEEDERQLDWEAAAILSPAVKINRVINSLIEKDDEDANFEAELLSAEMGMTLKMQQAGNVEQLPKPQKEKEAKQVMPMFGQGGGMGRAQEPPPQEEL